MEIICVLYNSIINKYKQHVIYCSLISFIMALYTPVSNGCISASIDNWTHIYMNFFNYDNRYCNLPKYLLFLLKTLYICPLRNSTKNINTASIHIKYKIPKIYMVSRITMIILNWQRCVIIIYLYIKISKHIFNKYFDI